MNVWNLIAMAPPPAGQEVNPKAQMMQMIGMFVILGVMFYFLLIRPQSKQRKEQENMLNNVKTGDQILTSGGIYGIVTNVKEKTLTVKIADKFFMKYANDAFFVQLLHCFALLVLSYLFESVGLWPNHLILLILE